MQDSMKKRSRSRWRLERISRSGGREKLHEIHGGYRERDHKGRGEELRVVEQLKRFSDLNQSNSTLS